MAILRAGPFASSTDSFLDEPSPPSFATSPVNCAMNDWLNDGWKAAQYINIYKYEGGYLQSLTYESGPDIELSRTLDYTTDVDGTLWLRFRYQATEDTEFTFTYSAGGVFNEAIVSIDGAIEFADLGSPPFLSPISGSEVITLPATVLPSLVSVSVGSTAYDYDATISVSISP